MEVLTKLVRDEVAKEQDTTSSSTAVVPMSSWMSRATLDIIGVAGMGQDFNAINDPTTELYVTYNKIFSPSKQAKILALLGQFIPFYILRAIPLKRNDDMEAAAGSIRSVARQLIRAKAQKMTKDKNRVEVDILSVALESGGFTEDELVDQMMTFLAAGHETTASSMTWALLALSQHPEMQKRLREEVRTGLPSIGDTSTQMSAEVLDRLPYLHAVCNEVLRCYTPVPITQRETACDTSIVGQFVPKGTPILLCPAAVNQSKELWGEDALEFNPDRWIGPGRANSGGASSNYAFLTFLHGEQAFL